MISNQENIFYVVNIIITLFCSLKKMLSHLIILLSVCSKLNEIQSHESYCLSPSLSFPQNGPFVLIVVSWINEEKKKKTIKI